MHKRMKLPPETRRLFPTANWQIRNVLCSLIALVSCSAALSAQTPTPYALTVEAGPLSHRFDGFGVSETGHWLNIPSTPRGQMADMVYEDLNVNVLRMWAGENNGSTGIEIPLNDMLSTFNTTYIASGLVADATLRGVDTLLLAPGGRSNPPASVVVYAEKIAEFIYQVDNLYNVHINVTGIANEPGFNWTNQQIIDCVTTLRDELDARGMTDVEIVAPECSSHAAAAVFVEPLSNDSTAWDSLMGIGSHSYGSNMINDKLEDLKQDKKWWMTEASDNAQEFPEDENRAATILSRFLCDVNHGVNEWIFFIGSGKVNDVYNPYLPSTAFLMVYEASTSSIVPFLKYYYFKQALNTIEEGAIFRKCISDSEGEMFQSPTKYNPAISAAAAYNPDGSWGINIVNETGITGSPSTSSNLFYPSENFDVTIKVDELSNTPSIDFDVTRSSANSHIVPAGTVTFTYGVGTVTVSAKELVSLRSDPTLAAIPTVPDNLVASTLNAPVFLTWNNTVKATSWNVKRATQSGGPYTTIATTTDTRYYDIDAEEGTLYYYVVSAENAVGESADSVEVAVSPTPYPWSVVDIGSVSTPGYYHHTDDGVFTIEATGSQIGGTADNFNFIHKPMIGDGVTIARLTYNERSNSIVGIMMAEDLQAQAKAATLVFNFNGTWNKVMMNTRTTSGSHGQWSSSSFTDIPVWLKLERVGNTFSGYASYDGTSWTFIKSANITMGSTIYTGLVNVSGNSNALNESVMDNVLAQNDTPIDLKETASPGEIELGWTATFGADSYAVSRATSSGGPYTLLSIVSSPAISYTDSTIIDGTDYFYKVSATNGGGTSPDSTEYQAWLNKDIGSVATTGTCSVAADGTFTSLSSGTAIGGSSDSFNYTYRTMTGDGVMIARVESSSASNTIVGIMMADDLQAQAKAATLVYNFNGTWKQVMMSNRTTSGTYGQWTLSSFTDVVPVWLKLERSGSTFSGYASYDGTNWTLVKSTSINMGSTICVGLVNVGTNSSSNAVWDQVSAP